MYIMLLEILNLDLGPRLTSIQTRATVAIILNKPLIALDTVCSW